MNEAQRIWAMARDGLVEAVTGLGFFPELAEVLASELKSPKAIDRLTSYVRQARPRTEEMLVDEMLAIRAEIDAWRERKTSLEAQARYSAMLFDGPIGEENGEDGD